MKRYLMLLCLLFMSFVVSSQTTTPDSLKNALQKATSERSRLEILTNLMDISRNDDILVNAKQLYQEALKANDNYYKEAALTEILRHYINTDQTDSANAYIAKAEQELKGEARTSLVSFMKMIQDTRVIFYTSGEPRRKVLMNCLFKLEEPDKLSPYEKIACNYVLGMAVSNSVMEENMRTSSKGKNISIMFWPRRKNCPYDMRTISCLTPISCYALMRVTLKNEDNMLPVT